MNKHKKQLYYPSKTCYNCHNCQLETVKYTIIDFCLIDNQPIENKYNTYCNKIKKIN